MLTPVHPFSGVRFGSDSSHASSSHQSQTGADHLEQVRARHAHLRNREAHLEPEQLVELFELNEAQRLQRAVEADRLAYEDVDDAVRLTHLRQAFASPGHQFVPVGANDRFDREHSPSSTHREHSPHTNEQEVPQTPTRTAAQNRLEHLSKREEHLDAEQLAELCDLREAQRLQHAIEQDQLADEDVREATRLAHLRQGFASIPQGTDTPDRPGTPHSAFVTAHSSRSSTRSSSPSRPTEQHPSQGFPLSTEDLFGSNLRDVTLRQRNNSTCYLLSAFDSILQHPQGRRILDLIRVNLVDDGYLVKFPGHPEPIHVPERDLRGSDVPESNQIGIPVIWNAYLQLPGAKDKHVFDNTNDAIRRMFGDRVAPTMETINTTVAESSRQRNHNTNSADIWTLTRVVRNQQGQAVRSGLHYFSLRPNQNGSFSLANPDDTRTPELHFNNQQALAEAFNPELTRIRLN